MLLLWVWFATARKNIALGIFLRLMLFFVESVNNVVRDIQRPRPALFFYVPKLFQFFVGQGIPALHRSRFCGVSGGD